MKRSTLWIVVIYAVLALALGACRREAVSDDAAATQTIEPAKPQPAEGTDTAALTQTVDVEAGRSEVEGRTASGADITAMSSDTVTTSTVSTTTTTTTARPPTSTTTR
ncbi:MAG TPA: hypothetical protein VFV49_03640 [Thermoanaerobaculia bacterium]|nr:hypothetical protein [Thermoanaerobaculia bacterium]